MNQMNFRGNIGKIKCFSHRSITASHNSNRKIFIKKAITGKGAASKEQVAAMVKSIVQFKQDPQYLDATDALAVAVCHHFQGNSVIGKQKSYSGWDSFLKNNPDRKI